VDLTYQGCCHRRPYKSPEEDRVFLGVYDRWSDLGLAPEIIEITAHALFTRCHQTLEDWLKDPRSDDELRAMGRRLHARVVELHSHGMCHRDLHAANVVIRDDGSPLFIDPGFATDSNPEAPCYDLVGPVAAGMPVLEAHASQTNGNQNGVYWDADTPAVRTLASIFGRHADSA
jgi:hypothetical protein